MRDSVLWAVDMHGRIGGERPEQAFTVPTDNGTAVFALLAGELERECSGRGKPQCRCAAAVKRRACAAVHLRLQRHTAALEQNAASAQAAELVRRKAHRVDAGEINRDAADGLRRVDMQAAVRITGEQLCDLADRLNRAELTVHSTERDEYGIRAQQLAHLLGVDCAVAADAQQVDLPAALLKCSQAAADRGMLERSGDDVPADVARGLCDTLDGEIVRLGRARGENDLGGGCAGERRDLLGCAGHLLARGPACGVA